MKRKISPFKLGLFVLAGAIVLLGGLLWIGAVKLFRPTETYAAIFTFSIGGLQKGAPVKYLGVEAGEVSTVDIGPDDRSVVVLLNVSKKVKVDGHTVAELESGGITGKPFLSLIRMPQPVERPRLPFAVKHPVIPTRRGGIAQMEEQAKRIMSQLEQADLPGLVREWRQTAQEVSGAVASGDIRQTIGNVRAASADLQAILQGLSGAGKPEQWRGIFRDIVATADNLRRSTGRLSAQLDALPPEALADLNRRMDKVVATGEHTLTTFNKQGDQTMAMLEKSLLEVNRLLSEMEQLAGSLRQSPGRILEQPRSAEPFAK
ncbi:MAG: MlaD family protein [Desulfobacteraceae bacterium]|nr:MlaD family protein [Desulfobacteraceae bacterium]